MIERLKALVCILVYKISFKKVCFGDCKYCKL